MEENPMMPVSSLTLIGGLLVALPVYIATNRRRTTPRVRLPQEVALWQKMPEGCGGDSLPEAVPALQNYAVVMQALYPLSRRWDACTTCQKAGSEVNRFYRWHRRVNEKPDWLKSILVSILFRHIHLSYTGDELRFVTAHAFCPKCLRDAKLCRISVFVFELVASLVVIGAGLTAFLPILFLLVPSHPQRDAVNDMMWLGTCLVLVWLGMNGRWWADQWRYPAVVRVIGRSPWRLEGAGQHL